MSEWRFFRDVIVILAIALGVPLLLAGMDNDATEHAEGIDSGLVR